MEANKLRIADLLHGADYNPEQWLDHPDILARDIELMKEAHCNVVSMGMFSWSMLEPEEGNYQFEWLESVINNLYNNGIYTFLSTPSGARPHWLAKKYPEVLRVEKNRVRNLFGLRHNHCYTSPAYREKVAQINGELAKRFANHPGVLLWHLSNEYGGECHCPLCQEAFRNWLKQKYQTLDALNDAWWTTFWSHRYTSWDQIESPAPHGEMMLHGLNLDWYRFVSHQTLDFVKWEKDSVKSYNPELPVTINMMYYFYGINYFDTKDLIDIVSWDSYPVWHKAGTTDLEIGCDTAMMHDIMRSIKNEPFLLMESTPSMTNWQNVAKLKKPGMHMLSSMQAVAHGSNSVQYFQWRKSRGASEKFHGAVVDHYGKSDTRVFREVSELGQRLEGLTPLTKTCNQAQVAILFDWENRWAIDDMQGPRNIGMHYKETVQQHYKAFWKMGIPTDFVDMSCDISKYKVLVAPMMYLLRNGFEQKIKAFVEAGGTLITTYWSGIVNETDLCYLEGTPHGLMDVVGLRSEEIDGLFDGETNSASATTSSWLTQSESYTCSELCDLIIPSTAKTLMTYNEDFYTNQPALTVNSFGQGQAYYIATKFEDKFYDDFYAQVLEELGIKRPLDTALPEGIIITDREGYLFIQNFNREAVIIPALPTSCHLIDGDKDIHHDFTLNPFEVLIVHN
ncbi:beta-galactosidase [Turicibacter bilis]|uniref:Beta-galactosidase n=1 Tax=Turicibacter bilis TaxID=2735723 RepID=A0ABY5JDW3_9FIRM|nr:beta-galactosidase [Turicibacter bilis]MBS3201620.1 beta-galactosidase [Turicibacter bilis]UUF04876.1 beta-galactosidase [Turicibacter bilis]